MYEEELQDSGLQQQQDDERNHYQSTKEAIEMLRAVNEEIAKLQREKEALIDTIIGLFEHKKDGQATYSHDIYNVECKTSFNYTLDKKKIDLLTANDKTSAVVKERVTYTVDKNLCEELLNSDDKEVKTILSEVVTKKPAKASIKISERV